jgi:hypothetical protein
VVLNSSFENFKFTEFRTSSINYSFLVKQRNLSCRTRRIFLKFRDLLISNDEITKEFSKFWSLKKWNFRNPPKFWNLGISKNYDKFFFPNLKVLDICEKISKVSINNVYSSNFVLSCKQVGVVRQSNLK